MTMMTLTVSLVARQRDAQATRVVLRRARHPACMTSRAPAVTSQFSIPDRLDTALSHSVRPQPDVDVQLTGAGRRRYDSLWISENYKLLGSLHSNLGRDVD